MLVHNEIANKMSIVWKLSVSMKASIISTNIIAFINWIVKDVSVYLGADPHFLGQKPVDR